MSEEIERACLTLLRAVWHGIPPAYKKRYASSIWEQFEDAVRAATYTSNVARFLQQLKDAFDAAIPHNFLADVDAILRSGKDKEILKALREETAALVVALRVELQQKKAEWLFEGGES